jgi:hypothetical protein
VSSTARLRLAIAAAPALLADALASLLPGDIDVTLLTELAEERFDVAIVTPGAIDVVAEAVVVLDDDPLARGGGTLAVAGVADQQLDDLLALLAVLDGLRPDGEV